MTRASDTAKLLGAGATILDGTTISTADNTVQLSLTSTDADANSGPELELYRNSASPADNDFAGTISFQAENDAGEKIEYGVLKTRVVDASDGTEDFRMTFEGKVGGSDVQLLKMDNSNIVFNEDSVDIDFRVESNGNANMLFVDGGNDNVCIGTATVRNAGLLSLDFSSAADGGVGINDTNSGNGAVFIGFLTGGTFRGSITNNNNSAVAYNTTSDYRLKENVSYTFDATTRLKQLKPARFNWIADDTNTSQDGFLAHEVSSVVPEAITGTKDEMKTTENVVLDVNENIIARGVTEDEWVSGKKNETYSDDTSWKASITQKHWQQIDHSKLVPLLVKTIQELEARITTLENA